MFTGGSGFGGCSGGGGGAAADGGAHGRWFGFLCSHVSVCEVSVSCGVHWVSVKVSRGLSVGLLNYKDFKKSVFLVLFF